MNALAAVSLALTIQTADAAAPQVDAEQLRSTPAAHAQNIEAFAGPDIQRSVPTAIVALNGRQLKDPTFHPIANRLGEALHDQGFNVVDGERRSGT